MSELPEIIGSMPSTPEQKLLQQKPESNNFGTYIGLFFCGVCLLAFPMYVNVDDLSTGIFYGVGFILLFIAVVGLSSRLVRGRKPLKATESDLKLARPRKTRGLYTTRLFFVLVLFGLYLLTFPTKAGLLWGIGFIALFTLVIVVYYVISRRVRHSKKSIESQQRSMSNSLDLAIGYLFFGLYLLVLPKLTNMNDFVSGLLYGIGLTISLFATIGLCNAIFKRGGDKALPGQ